jgi:hypothetical protein
LFPLVTVRKLVREVSDHNALLLDTVSHAIPLNTSREFHFDLSWFKNVEFLHSAALVLNRFVPSNDPIAILNIKLKRFKKYFKGWGSIFYGHNKKLKRELKEELASIEALEKENDLTPDLNLRKTDNHVQLFNLFAG